jgi:hypothetical protein
VSYRKKGGISPSTKACPAQWSVIDNSAIKRLASERQIDVAPLSLIAVHPGSGPALQFPSAVDVKKEP